MKYQSSVYLLTGDAEKETKDKTVVFNPYSSTRDSKVSISVVLISSPEPDTKSRVCITFKNSPSP